MKIGDIVVLIDNNWTERWKADVEFPVKNVYYTIRDIGTHLSSRQIEGVLLEEIVNPRHQNGNEYCFRSSRFRKVDMPNEVNDAIEELLRELEEREMYVNRSETPRFFFI